MDWYDFLNPHEQPENECKYCGEPCDGEFCDRNCAKGYESDN